MSAPSPAAPSAEPVPLDDGDEISLLDLALTVAENLRLLVLGSLAVGVVALGASFLITPTFTASTLLMPPQQQQSAASMLAQQLGALGGALGGAAAGLKNPNDQYVALLKSRAVEDRLIERFGLMDRYEVKLRDDARLALEARTRVSSGKDSLIRIEFDDHDPAFAAQVANAYVVELSHLMKTLAVTEAQQRRAFFEKLLGETRDKLTQAQQALAVTGVNPSALRGSPEATVTPLAQLQAQIRVQEVRLGVMRGYLAESAPEFRRAQDELAALRQQVQKAGAALPAAGADADYVARFREFKYQETLFELFSRQYEIARVDESREGAVIQVVDAAQPPERKSKPKKAMIAVVATLATGFALLLFVIARQAWRSAGQSPATADKVARLRQLLRGPIGRRGVRAGS
jgi:tyrosine-protein kinase Etk/Wzc